MKHARQVNPRQRALAAVVREKMAGTEPPVKAAHIQRQIGVGSSAWGTYFVQCTQDVPMSVLFGVAEYLGEPLSELLRLAEVRAARNSSQDDLGPLTTEAEEAVEQGRREHPQAPDPDDDEGTMGRSSSA